MVVFEDLHECVCTYAHMQECICVCVLSEDQLIQHIYCQLVGQSSCSLLFSPVLSTSSVRHMFGVPRGPDLAYKTFVCAACLSVCLCNLMRGNQRVVDTTDILNSVLLVMSHQNICEEVDSTVQQSKPDPLTLWQILTSEGCHVQTSAEYESEAVKSKQSECYRYSFMYIDLKAVVTVFQFMSCVSRLFIAHNLLSQLRRLNGVLYCVQFKYRPCLRFAS